MSKSLLLLGGAFILILCAPATVPAQIGHSIRGKVRNGATGANLPRVVVDLHTGNGLPINKTIANDEGDFSFSGLIESNYQVIVSAPDFQTATETVDFGSSSDENRPGETRLLDITLNPNPGARIAPGRVTFSQDVPPPARAAYERGLKLLREGKAQEFVAAAREAVKIFPDYFDAHFALGSEMMKLNRLDEAIAEFDHARRINPNEDRVYYAFGLIMMRQRKPAVAARIFSEAARLNQSEAQYPLQRGTVLIDQAAMIDASKSKAAASERSFALNEAEKALLRAHELSGRKLAAVHLQLSRLYEKRGDRARAADELELYLKKNPGDRNAAALREGVKKLRAAAGN